MMSVSTPESPKFESTQLWRNEGAIFESFFGRPVTLWTYSDQWRCVTDQNCGSAPVSTPDSCPDDRILCVAASAASHLELLTRRDATPCAAIVPLPEATDSLLQMLVRLWNERHQAHTELSRLADENESLVLQVSDDFEELAFLRAIAGELELTSGRYSMTHVMDKILPLLRQTIKAESVIVMEQSPVTKRRAGEGTTSKVRVTYRDGDRNVDDQWYVDMLGKLIQSEAPRTLVRNHIQDGHDAPDFPGVSELILVPISKNDRMHGWMLILNRLRWQLESSDQYWQHTRLEFGTPEASIARTTATLLASHAQNVELFQQKEELLTDMVRALVNAIEAKDEYTRGHSERVALFAQQMGRALNLNDEDCDRLYLTGLLHDVGKIGVNDATLHKPDRLTDSEYNHIQRHPEGGWAILHGLEHLSFVLPGVLHHHEKFDGTGYPDKLSGESIPLDARILAICDSYDAMTSDRPYRQGMSQQFAEQRLRSGAATYWDPQLLATFFGIMPDIIAIRETFVPRVHPPRRPLSVSDTAQRPL